MILKHVKLRNREDILCFIKEQPSNTHITIMNPLAIEVTPEEGIFAKNWMMFTDGDTVSIPINTVMFVGNANPKAVEYYDEFFKKLKSKIENSYDEETLDEYEEMFQAMLDSKRVVKH